MNTNKLIFNNIRDALDYSKRNYNGNNIIKSLETDKTIAGKCSMQSNKNPILYVVTSKVEIPKKVLTPVKLKYKSKVLTGFDQL